MGGDGGVIAVKRGFIRGCKNKADEEAKDAEGTKRQSVNRSKHCAISNDKLVEPIVACQLGNLYKKEALLTALLEKTLNSKFSHIRGLKDVKVLRFTPNPDFRESSDIEGLLLPQFRCPVTQMDFNGLHPFVFIWSTGWVLAEKAVRELGIDALQEEYGPFVEDDIIRLIPSEEEAVGMRERMETQRKMGKKKRHREGASVDEPSRKQHHASSSSAAVGEGSSSKATEKVPSVPTTSASARPSDVSLVRGSATAAAASVSKKESDSEVYKKLFHTDKDAKTGSRDLMMSTAGFRYGLA